MRSQGANDCSCSAIMSPPNCSAKMSPPKLGGGLESKAVTKNRSDRECGGRAGECGRSGPGAGAQRAAGEAAQTDLRRLRAELGVAWQSEPGAGEPDAGATAAADHRVGARQVCRVQRHTPAREAGARGRDPSADSVAGANALNPRGLGTESPVAWG